MKRVVYAWNYLEWGGAQIHILALIKEVRKKFDLLVVLPEGSSVQLLQFLEDLSVRYEFFRPPTDLGPAPTVNRKIKKHWRKMRSEFAMLTKIREFDPAVVHVDLAPTQSLLSLVRLCLRTPVFITLHNALPAVGPVRDVLWHIKSRVISLFPTFHVFCSNEDSRKYFQAYYSSAVASNMEVTYTSINPIEIDEILALDFDREALLSKHGIPTDRPIVLAVGQFVDRKGRWTFLDAAKKVAADNNVIFLWMTPELPGDADVSRIDSYGLRDSFRLVLSSSVGSKRDEVLQFFRVADIFALPSFVEGLPIALLEAMALGIPSISTNVNGIPEAVKNGETGILIDAGDSDALANGIQRVLDDVAFAKQIGKKGREFVIRHFDEREAARTALRSYLDAVAS